MPNETPNTEKIVTEQPTVKYVLAAEHESIVAGLQAQVETLLRRAQGAVNVLRDAWDEVDTLRLEVKRLTAERDQLATRCSELERNLRTGRKSCTSARGPERV